MARNFVALLALFAASAAFAASGPPSPGDLLIGDKPVEGVVRDRETRQLMAKPGREVATAGVPFDLPADAVKPSALLKVSVLHGERLYVEETIVMPPAFNAAPTIAFLSDHPEELARVRLLAKARPEGIRFTVATDDKVIVDVPFVEADGGSVRLADGGDVVGTTRSVTFRMRDPRRVVVNEIDPACQAECDQAFYDCFTYCDERGAGCPWCHEQYEDCLFYCPQVCVEPKDEYQYWTGWGYIGSYNHGTLCINYASAYILWEDVFRRDLYERTVHCNNTYTDVYLGSQYSSSYCKEYIGPGCIGDHNNPPPNC